jgi:hypothetical protein
VPYKLLPDVTANIEVVVVREEELGGDEEGE